MREETLNSERKTSEVIKKTYSATKLEEHFQNKHGEKCSSTDTEAREEFSNITSRKIKCTAGNNTHGERIQLIDKKNMNYVCLLCNAIET